MFTTGTAISGFVVLILAIGTMALSPSPREESAHHR